MVIKIGKFNQSDIFKLLPGFKAWCDFNENQKLLLDINFWDC